MSRPKKNEEPITEAAKDATILAAEIRSSDMSATEALVAGISACGNIQATRVNPHFRSRYFGLGDLLAQVKPTLASYGLVILQVPYTSEDRISVRTEILHGKSGQRFDFGELGIKAAGLNLQATGSALSYLKRYAIATIVGVASDDETEDDGNAASRPIQHTAPKAQAAAQPAAKPAWFIAAGITTPQAQEVAAELLRRKGWLGAGDGLQELDEAKIAALHQGRMLQTFVDAIRAQLETPNA